MKLECEECGAAKDLYLVSHLSENEEFRTTFLLCLKHVQDFKGVDERVSNVKQKPATCTKCGKARLTQHNIVSKEGNGERLGN